MRLLVVYASQTGNAQDVAEGIGREAAYRLYEPQVAPADGIDPSQLPAEQVIIFVAATAGQGDPPDNFKRLWKFFLKKSLPSDSLIGTKVAVFGLGDSGYVKYNVVAKRLAARLSALGAKELLPTGLGDDQSRTGYEGALDPWKKLLWQRLRELYPLPPGVQEPPAGDDMVPDLGTPKFQVTWLESTSTHPPPQPPSTAAVHAAVVLDQVAGSGATLKGSSADNTFSAGRPLLARIVRNSRITNPQHSQDVRHIEVDLGDSGLKYVPGDSLGVWPETPATAVDEFLQLCGLEGSAYVVVNGSSGTPVQVRALVAGALDICSAPPRRYFFEVMSHFATAEHEKERLQYFASVEGRDDVYRYCNKERRSVLEVLRDFPSARPPLQWLLTIVPRLQPRYFSISSSLAAHPNTAHLTVAVVAWETPYKRPRVGLCSSWLAGLDPSVSENPLLIPVWVEPGSLRMPADASTPLVCVGPGTGVAPMRSFLQQRDAQLQMSNGAAACLFFGCRKQSMDYLYADEWDRFRADGRVLSSQNDEGGLFVAFSQDQASKVYVTNRIREQGALVWKLLSSGAYVYVSGASGKMPTDVSSAFEEVLTTHGGMDTSLAKQWLRKAETTGRYQVETWS